MVPAKLKDLVRGIGKRGSSAVTFAHVTERKRPEADSKVEYQELSVLYDLLGPISQTTELAKALDDAVVKIMEITGAEAASIRLSDKGGDRLLLTSHRGFPETYTREISSAFKGKVVQHVLKTGEPIISAELSGDMRFDRALLAKNGFRSAAYISLKNSQRVHGLMVLASREAGRIHKKQSELLMAIAHQISVALENAKLYQEINRAKTESESLNRRLQKSLTELSNLYTAFTPLAPAESINEMLDGVIERLIETTGTDAALVRMRDKASGASPCAAQRGFPEYYLKIAKTKPPGSAVDLIYKTGQPLISPDIERDPRFKGKIQLQAGLRSCVFLPLKVRGEVKGIIHLASRKLDYFQEDQTDYLMAIARQMGTALENRDLFDELRTSKDDLEKTAEDLKSQKEIQKFLKELSQDILSSRDFKTVLETILDRAMRVCGFDVGAVRLVDHDRQTIEVAASRGYRDPENIQKHKRNLIDPITGEWALPTMTLAHPRIEENLSQCEGLHTLKNEGVQSAVMVAVRTQKEILGIIQLGSRVARKFQPHEIQLLESIGSQMGIGLQKAKLFEETERRAEEISALNAVTTALSASLDLDEILEKSLNAALLVTGMDTGYVQLLSSDPARMTLKVHHGISPAAADRLRGGMGPGGKAEQIIATKKSVVLQNIGPDYTGKLQGEGIKAAAWVPIISREKVLGLISVATRGAQTFSAGQVHLLESIGASIGVALEKARLFEEADRRRKHAEALREIGLSLTSTHDSQQLLERIAEEARRLIDAMFTFVVTPDRPFYRFAAIAGDDQGYHEVLKLSDDPDSPYGQGPLGRAVRSGKPVICEDVLSDPLFVPWREIAAAHGIRSLVAVPLLVHQQPIGALLTYAAIPRAYDDETMSLLTSLGAQAATALGNARLFEKVIRKSQELESLVGINRDVASLLDQEILLPRIAEEARKILKVDGSVFRLVEGEHLVLRSVSDPEMLKFRPKMRVDESVSGKIIRENRVIAIRNVFEDSTIIGEHQEVLRKAGYRSFLGIPLRAKDHVIGALNFYSKEEREFQPDEIATIIAFADQAAIAIENADLYQKSRRQQEIQKLLKELSQDITSLDHADLFERLTQRVRDFFEVDICDVRMVGNWQPMGVSGIDAERIRGSGAMRGRARWIVENRKPLIIRDITQETDGPTDSSTRQIGIRGYLAVPLFSRGGEVVGILRALTYQPREFTQEEIDLLQQLANGAALALDNAKLFHETELRAREQAALNAIATATAQSLQFDELLQTALEKVLEVTGRNGAYIRLKDQVTGDLTMAAHRGLSEEYAKTLLYRRNSGGKSDQVFNSGEPLVITDPEGTMLNESARKEGIYSAAWIPLHARGKTLGILNVSTTRPIPFEDREVQLLQSMGNVIGVALDNARLFEETKLNEEYLRRARDHLENIFNSLDREMFWSSDPNSNALLYVSQGTENIYGISREAFSANPAFWKQVVHPADLPIVEAIDMESKFGNKVKKEYRIIRPKTGEIRWVQARIIPVLNERGKVMRIDGLLIDVTDSKQAEEALALKAEELARSNTELQHFAYIASHDLQEPLRMVAGYTQLLAKRYKGKLDSDAQEFIDFAVDGVVRMQALINALLAYSRIGTKGKEFEPTDLNSVLDYTLTNLRAAIQESGAVVTRDPLPTVMADATQLGQLLQNLIGNAVKFHGPEVPRIHLSSQQKDSEWLLSVKDNGIGIDPQYAERIFVIFQRLHNKQEYPGTGIGLALCKKIVERHGGRIWMESQSGQGTTFYFTMPK